MKRYLINLLAFSFPILAFGLLVNFLQGIQSSDYMSAISLKHDRLDKIQGPRLIVAGGSNMAFGIDSEMIETELKIPVTNLALHAGLGMSFIINELSYCTRKGDIILLSPEYFLTKDGMFDLKENASKSYKPAHTFYSAGFLTRAAHTISRLRLFLTNTQTNLKALIYNGSIENRKIKAENAMIYSKAGFNEYGDMISHIEKNARKELMGRVDIKYEYWSGISIMNEFKRRAKSKGINVFFLFPNYPATQFAVNRTAIEKLESDLIDDLDIEILNKPTDFVFPDSLFFDTVYHLNGDGRKQRTEKLIKLIGNNNSLLDLLKGK